MKHTLKTHPALFRAVRDGRKNFDVRRDDRAFQAGDTVELTYHDPNVLGGNFPMVLVPWNDDDSQQPIVRTVTFVLRGGQYGVEPGYVVLALSEAV